MKQNIRGFMSIVPTKDDIINCYKNQEVLINATINNLNDKIKKLEQENENKSLQIAEMAQYLKDKNLTDGYLRWSQCGK